MAGVPREPSWAWLGAVNGTAIHEFIENRLHKDSAMSELFGNPLIEHRMVIGEIEGYGPVKSTSDLYIPHLRTVWDHKTTTKAKLKQYVIADEHDLQPDPDLFSQYAYDTLMEHAFTMRKYLNQLHLYGLGMVREGQEVTDVAMAFVCRDGLSQEDIKVFRYKYDPELAQRVWDRIELLWMYLQDGKTPEEFDGHIYCWYCQNKRG